MKPSAIGVVEISYYTNALIVLDDMAKSSGVELAACYKTLGGQMVHLVVSGTTSQVMQAIESARETGGKIAGDVLKTAIVISNPHQEVLNILGIN